PGLLRPRRRSRRSCETLCAIWPEHPRKGSTSRWPRPPPRSWPAAPTAPVRGAARRHASASAETWKCAALACGVEAEPSSKLSSRLTSQGVHRIELDRPANGCRASGESYDNRDGQDHGEQHRLNGDFRIENRSPNLMGQPCSTAETDGAADHSQQ